jgi:CDP-diacylglycerol--glycerol-3-phosphate 3-phosphatidyltransferase
LIKSRFGEQVDGWIHALFPFLFRRRVDPNLLTALGAVVSLIAAPIFAAGWFGWGAVTMLFAGFFDLVDGVVARHHGISSRFGAFLDSTLDRVGDMAILLGIAMYYALAGEPGHVLLAGYALASSVLVSYAKARAELVVPAFKVGFLERAERVLIIAGGAIFGLMIPALWIISIGSTVTVIQRFARAYREMERIDAHERAGLGEHS